MWNPKPRKTKRRGRRIIISPLDKNGLWRIKFEDTKGRNLFSTRLRESDAVDLMEALEELTKGYD